MLCTATACNEQLDTNKAVNVSPGCVVVANFFWVARSCWPHSIHVITARLYPPHPFLLCSVLSSTGARRQPAQPCHCRRLNLRQERPVVSQKRAGGKRHTHPPPPIRRPNHPTKGKRGARAQLVRAGGAVLRSCLAFACGRGSATATRLRVASSRFFSVRSSAVSCGRGRAALPLLSPANLRGLAPWGCAACERMPGVSSRWWRPKGVAVSPPTYYSGGRPSVVCSPTAGSALSRRAGPVGRSKACCLFGTRYTCNGTAVEFRPKFPRARSGKFRECSESLRGFRGKISSFREVSKRI
jgi:hypothetical protein